MPFSGIVVVDDCEEWRRMIRSILQTRPELRILAEATDGAEGIERAGELKPDLIVLDIGLPRLNGIKAATRISEVSTASRILFLSEVNDSEVVQVALSTGASGYVHKCNAATELLPAVLATLGGSPRRSNEAIPPGVMESIFPSHRKAVSAVADPKNTAGQVVVKTAATHARYVCTLEPDDPWFTMPQSAGSSWHADPSHD
jgi:DNA-binding NarL/FixJ family response regulator